MGGCELCLRVFGSGCRRWRSLGWSRRGALCVGVGACVCECVCVCVFRRRLQAAAQFGRLGEESARLLSACEAERALRAKLEAGLHIKERQVLGERAGGREGGRGREKETETETETETEREGGGEREREDDAPVTALFKRPWCRSRPGHGGPPRPAAWRRADHGP